MVNQDLLLELYHRMYSKLGHLGWWPADEPFEVCVGAILTQNTNWKNVEKAIANLKSAGCLSPEKIAGLEFNKLCQLVRPSGFYKQKARRLVNFSKWWLERGGIDSLKELDTERLREELLNINGIGFETADSILLYAFERPVFVVDAYTYRILLRHNLIGEECDYNTLQEIFMSNLPHDVELFKNYHALLVEVGKRWCIKKRTEMWRLSS